VRVRCQDDLCIGPVQAYVYQVPCQDQERFLACPYRWLADMWAPLSPAMGWLTCGPRHGEAHMSATQRKWTVSQRISIREDPRESFACWHAALTTPTQKLSFTYVHVHVHVHACLVNQHSITVDGHIGTGRDKHVVVQMHAQSYQM
jgi:hypothetical protein